MTEKRSLSKKMKAATAASAGRAAAAKSSPLPATTPVKTWPRWAVIAGTLALLVGTPPLYALGNWMLKSGTVLYSDVTGAKFDPKAPFNVKPRAGSTSGHDFGIPRVISPDSPEGISLLDRDFPDDVVEIGSTDSDFLLTGNIGKDVVITKIRPVDVHVEAPVSATYVYIPTGGQGGSSHETIVFDLVAGDAMRISGGMFFDGDPMAINLESRLFLTLRVEDPPTGTTRWVYAIDIVSPDDEESVVYLDRRGQLFTDLEDINPEGRFSVTSLVENYSAVYSYDSSNSLAFLPGISNPPAP